MMEWNKCPGCGGTISGDADFCPDCGEPWTVKCANCGIIQRFWKMRKFCQVCGTRMELLGVVKSKHK
jgi:hypothetical protein